MVAPKRGRGAKSQAAKAKAAATNEQIPASDSEVQNFEAEDNGVSEDQENNSQAAAGETETTEGNESADGEQNAAAGETEAKAEEKPEEPKVESGKLLVENIPPTYLFEYQEKLKELFSKYGEINSIKRGPMIVTELTTSPTLSAIVEFKNKESVDKALVEEGTVLDGCAISVAAESRPETAVLVGVPYEASIEYVRVLFTQCGEIAHIQEFSKTKYKILRVTFHEKDAVDKALKLDRELRINGSLVTVSKYRDEEEQKAHNANINKKRQHPQQQNRPSNANSNSNNTPNRNNINNRARQPAFNARPNFRGGRGGRGGFAGRGGFPPRGGFVPPVTPYMPPQPYGMGRPGGFMDGQRPNKRMRQM